MHAVAAALHIHTVAVLVDAKTQTATDFLPLCGIAVRMLQSADLEHIRVVPALAQSRVGENEPRRFFKGQQPFLVFQNQVIRRYIIGELAAALELAVNAAPGFLINAKIPLVYAADIAAGRLQILLVRRIEQGCILVQNADVLLLKHLAVLAQNLVAVSVILSIFGDLINKEQGQALDALIKELFLFFKVR